MSMTEKDKEECLLLARRSIEARIYGQGTPGIPDDVSSRLKRKCGAFVTLKENNRLRGCIGRFGAEEELCLIIQEMALAAAFDDYRFPPVREEELDKIRIEISVLSPLKKIESVDDIRMGIDGIYIRKGNASGTFLPQVASETGWSREEFLGHCASDKAGIGYEGWKDADIYVYEADVFSE